MTYIASDLVKNSVLKELLRLFPGIDVYKEAVTNPTFPHCFVYQVSLNETEERKGRYILHYLMNVRYRTLADPSKDTKLQQNLDEASIKLSEGFNIIPLADTYVRCKDKTIEKADGILQMTFSIDILCKKVNKNDIPSVKMKELYVIINQKENLK